MRGRFFLASAAVALVFSVPAAADEQCHLVRQASLDMRADVAGGVDVPMTIAGHPLMLLVDTGGLFEMLTQSTVNVLGLQVDYIPEAGISMYGGTRITRYVTATDIQLGQMKGGRSQFLVLPDGNLPPSTDGMLAPDFLSRFDVEFDFANAKLNLFAPNRCDLIPVYWTKDSPFAVVPFRQDGVHHITLHVQLEGKDVEAILDTGSTVTRMSLEEAEGLFDIKPDSPGMMPIRTRLKGGQSYRYPFKILSFQGIEVANPVIALDPDSSSQKSSTAPPMILGMGVLRQLHLYISYKEHNMYVTAASAH
jgi:predicted aspartyl protease